MKMLFLSLLHMFVFIFSYRPCLAQIADVHAKLSSAKPYELHVTTGKTTSLIFARAIKSVDRGSADLLVQQARGVDNILQLKAARENFSQTNLTVITSEGTLYSLLVSYDPNPTDLTISLRADTFSQVDEENGSNLGKAAEQGASEASMISTAENIAKFKKSSLHGRKVNYYKMKFSLNGIYIQQGIMYFQIRCANSSNIDYDVDMLRFYLRDLKRSRRTASQELELKPIYVAGNPTRIPGKSKMVCVAALPKFTIPNTKYLAIEVKEKNGGRDLLLKIHNRHIIHAQVIK